MELEDNVFNGVAQRRFGRPAPNSRGAIGLATSFLASVAAVPANAT
jgi:hypothetical protein